MSDDMTPDIIGGRYVLGDQLGRGGMGAVYRATDRLTGDKIALKRVMIPMSRVMTYSAFESAQNLNLALAQEFRVMASLRHPNVISVLDYGFDDAGQPYFTMELLRDAITLFRAGWRSDVDKVNLMIQLLQALSYLHRRGIIHRDLKPANVMVMDGQVRVLDFGLALLRAQISKDNATQIAGTVRYIAPEIFYGDPPTPSSDLYSVGIIGYELFTGTSPFNADETNALIEEIITQIPKMSLVQNQRIAAVLFQLLSKEPDTRFSDADAVIAALSNAANQPVPRETVAIRESFLQAASFVGREAELEQLVSLLTDAKSGKGSAILVGGESGVGKTRLLDELRTQALVQGLTVLRGQNSGEGDSLYQMWRPVLRWLALVTPLDDIEAALLKFIILDIETLLDRDLSKVAVNPSFIQERLQALIEKIFQQQTRPILLILEDLHWVSNESMAALKRLISAAGSLPLLIVGSYRNDERKDLPILLSRAKTMQLSRLPEKGIVDLAVGILGDAGRQPELLDFLKRETEGNVFFLVEVVRALAEQAGKLGQVGRMQLPEHIFAGGIDEILQRRLDRIPEVYRHTVQLAAIYGPLIDRKILQHLSESPVLLEQCLTFCANSAVLDIRDGEWRFAHEKLRDRILADLPPEQRRELHKLVATALETVYLYSQEYTNSVAYHWAMAGDSEKEQHYASQAGKQALNSGAFEEASRYLERALALSQSEGTHEASTQKKLATLKQQVGEAYVGLGRYDNAKRLYKESLDLFQQASYKWGVATDLNDLGEVAYMQGDFSNARAHWHDALKTAMSSRALQVALTSITGLARLAVQQQQPERAVELVSLALANLAIDRPTADRAEQLLQEVRSKLSPEAFAIAEERGRSGSLAEVAKSILDV